MPHSVKEIIVMGISNLTITHPQLAAEWHPTKNGDLTPENVTYGSNKKVWWLCPKGHDYQAKIGNRAMLGRGCPYCAGKRVIVGINDLATTHPQLAAEWHPAKNGDLTPRNVTYGSGKKVW